MSENQQEQVQQENGKVEKKFTTNLSKLVSLMGQPLEAATKTRVTGDEMGTIVDELLKERKAQTIVTFKQRASALLDKKVEFDKFVKQKQKELETAILEKKKEFSKQMEECFALVDNIDTLHREYVASLQETATED